MKSYKLEFLMCGSPTDAFYSQAAMYRLFLDSFGGIYKKARLVLVLGDHVHQPLPERWRPYYENIEIHWSDYDSFICHGDGSDYLFELIDDAADISFIVDADTMLVKPLPDEFLRAIVQAPAVCGVLAHYTPLRRDSVGHDYTNLSSEDFWHVLSQHVLGKNIDLPFLHTLTDNFVRCPFYINYGFVAGTPSLLKNLHGHLDVVQPKIREVLDNEFYGQIGITFALEQGDIPFVSLPMRYNFPNDPIADSMYQHDLDNVCVIHYLRTNIFDRHKIFTDSEIFREFLSLELSGSNTVFQKYVRECTHGEYPFPYTN